MTPTLNREIVRHVLGSFGFVPPPNFGKVGVSLDDFRQEEGFELEFENDDGQMEKKTFGLWCGECEMGGTRLKVLGTDVCDNENNYHEFSVVYQVDESPIHAVKHVFDDESPALYLVKLNTDTGIKWKEVGAEQRLIACAGLEKINSVGLTWNSSNDVKDLLPALLEVVEM